MSTGHYQQPSDPTSYLLLPELTPGLYDGTSCESSASSPMNCNTAYEPSYTTNNIMPFNGFSLQYPMHSEEFAPVGLIPVELDVDSLYQENQDRRRKKGGKEREVSSYVRLRRQAQNRKSQRAFRDGKDKHMKDLETKLEELEGRHAGLTKSYESLQQEYSLVKADLDRLRKEKEDSTQDAESDGSLLSGESEWDQLQVQPCDPALYETLDYWSGEYAQQNVQ